MRHLLGNRASGVTSSRKLSTEYEGIAKGRGGNPDPKVFGNYAGDSGGDGTAGSFSPRLMRRAVSRRPLAGTCFVAFAKPKSGMLL